MEWLIFLILMYYSLTGENDMKKLSVLAICVPFLFPLVTNAASFVVTPDTGVYKAGDIVALTISVNPEGNTIYTAMLDASFSRATLEIISFSLNDQLLPLRASGYETLDNVNGVLRKTGGYTGGITSLTTFGTIQARVKNSGTATFMITDNSQLLDVNNVDQQRGTQTFSYEIKTVTRTTPGKTTPVKSAVPTKTQEENLPTVTTREEEIPVTITSKASSTQTAAIGDSGTGNNLPLWAIGIIGAIALFVAGYFVGNRYRRT